MTHLIGNLDAIRLTACQVDKARLPAWLNSFADLRSNSTVVTVTWIEVEIPRTRTGPPEGINDSRYPWNERRQRWLDEEYVDRTTLPDVRYRKPKNPKNPVSQEKWDKYRQNFGDGELPSDYGHK